MTAAQCGKIRSVCCISEHSSPIRVTDRYKLTQALVVDPLYLQHSYSESAIDYRVSCLTFDL